MDPVMVAVLEAASRHAAAATNSAVDKRKALANIVGPPSRRHIDFRSYRRGLRQVFGLAGVTVGLELRLYQPGFPSRLCVTVPCGPSFLLTAAGQSWIRTRFPFQHSSSS